MASTVKHDWPMVRLGDVCEVVSGGTPKTSVEEYWGGEIPWVTPADLSKLKGLEISSGERAITQRGVDKSSAVLLPAGSVVLSSRAPIGYVAIAQVPMTTNQGCKSFIPSSEIDARYLAHYLLSQKDALQSLGTGATFKELSKTRAADIRIPLPPLDEQRRIAAVLDEVGRLSSIQIKKVEGLEALKRVVVEEFLKARGDQEVELGTISEIQSGITKGRKVSKKSTTSIVPYLSVSNVKDGFLQLHPVKEINATNDEISRYQLQRGDIVLTEGGDPDKLGRGTVWNNEIPVCIHQNHIFRVRILQDSTVMTPEVLAAILSSSRPKKHFLRSAKQTTGIASINKSQLSRTPIPNLTRDDVRALSLQIELLKLEQERAETQRSSFEELRQSLSTRAFQGEL
ncbi:restriction endonuclease subunit S [Corynebacterium guaraldiae]|uniref:Restriction endonuclease subunit S n=1 Tax=Corynebacterium guaraldiae TaxID=3051103 RepID=A0ABY3CTQ4_9CORY|nr:restriction endonuclease subunit S [Corynebacterium guaraldiae]TRX48940.1 restriction endonuclease subunit S [Corynebacterium guaraldiae]